MTDIRFVQMHTLQGYPAVLLNRDDAGLAKRIPYGGASRTRISSQCLKRHWRTARSADALDRMEDVPGSVRSRNTIPKRVTGPLIEAGADAECAKRIETVFNSVIYSEEKADDQSKRQPLLLGEPEIAWLLKEAKSIAAQHPKDPDKTLAAAQGWAKSAKANLRAMRTQCRLPGGLIAALCGRMVTSDTYANIDAALHVAHAWTTHQEETENDYFTVVDDLLEKGEEGGAAHIGDAELTSGLYYGYVVVDRGTLMHNLAGEAEVGGKIVRRLLRLIATVTPGAKLGSTAPYGYAQWILVEAGGDQPRSLGEAFRRPCRTPDVTEAETRLNAHLEKMDRAYGNGNSRRVLSLSGQPMNGAEAVDTLETLANWAGDRVEAGTV